jgi:hypothetical protein
MTIHELLTATRTAGIQLEARGSRLHVEAPAGAMTDALRSELKRRKPDLLPVLWRLEAMRRLAVEAPRPVVYARVEARGGPGHCFSCGDAHEHPEAYGRCVPCDVASDLYYATKHDKSSDVEEVA